MAAVMTELSDAKNYRASTAKSLLEIAGKQEGLAHEHAALASRLDRVEPVADFVTGFRAKMTGALMILGIIGGILWAGVSFFKEKIIALLGG